jgi:hypothetical protein
VVNRPGLVLDTAALLAYADRAERIGRFVAAVADRGESLLIPATCLATAYQRVTSDGWDYLDVIANLTHAVVAPLTGEHCAVLGGWARTLGLDSAHAAIEAAAHAVVPLMTAQRDLITGFLPKDWPIIDV